MTPTKLLIGQILVVFAIVIAGIWFATQWAAWRLAYQPELGLPWFTIGPLFVIGEQSDAQLVNYRMAGRFYVIDRLFGTAELRLGGRKQSVVRITRTADRSRRGTNGRTS